MMYCMGRRSIHRTRRVLIVVRVLYTDRGLTSTKAPPPLPGEEALRKWIDIVYNNVYIQNTDKQTAVFSHCAPGVLEHAFLHQAIRRRKCLFYTVRTCVYARRYRLLFRKLYCTVHSYKYWYLLFVVPLQ